MYGANTDDGVTLTICIEDHQFQPKNFWYDLYVALEICIKYDFEWIEDVRSKYRNLQLVSSAGFLCYAMLICVNNSIRDEFKFHNELLLRVVWMGSSMP